MDAGDLRIFAAVARHGGMSRASEALHTVQSNVTARIRQLEEELGTPLFQRHSRGVSLTPAGDRLLPYADQVLGLLADARRAVHDDGTPRGRLLLGTLETTAALRLSPRIADFVSRNPDVDLILRADTTAELIARVLARDLEGALVCGPVSHPDLAAEPLFREELVLATRGNAAGFWRADPPSIVVLRAGCSYRRRLEEILAHRGIVGARVLEFGTLDAIIGCVAAGLGATLLPRDLLAARSEMERLTLTPVTPAEGLVETQFIRRADGFVSSAMGAFLDCVRPLRETLIAAE